MAKICGGERSLFYEIDNLKDLDRIVAEPGDPAERRDAAAYKTEPEDHNDPVDF
jgi:hypothetical protein